MERLKPPFRADHVGSLLRTAALKDAREKHARGEIGADALTASFGAAPGISISWSACRAWNAISASAR
jgi:hypothetical protein